MKKQLAIVMPIGPGDKTWESFVSSYKNSNKIYFCIGEYNKEEFTLELQKITNKNLDFEVVNSKPGRANQQNIALNLIEEDYILFLHADSEVSKNSLKKLEDKLISNPATIYFFHLYFTDSFLLMKVTELGVILRCFVFSLPFGDQGFAMSKEIFQELQGFPDEQIGEDLLFITKAIKKGIKIKSNGLKLGTSSRKYQGKWLKTTVSHLYYTFKLYFKK